MSGTDKIKHTAEDLAGKAKEGAGKLTGNESLEAEGKMDQVKADAKKAADDVKDAAKDAGDHVSDAARKATDRRR